MAAARCCWLTWPFLSSMFSPSPFETRSFPEPHTHHSALGMQSMEGCHTHLWFDWSDCILVDLDGGEIAPGTIVVISPAKGITLEFGKPARLCEPESCCWYKAISATFEKPLGWNFFSAYQWWTEFAAGMQGSWESQTGLVPERVVRTLAVLANGKGKSRSHSGLYDQLVEGVFDGVRAGDTQALEGFMAGEALRVLKSRDVTRLWRVCQASRKHSEACVCVVLDRLISQLQELYPWVSPAAETVDIELPCVAKEFQLALPLDSTRSCGDVERQTLIKPSGNACVL